MAVGILMLRSRAVLRIRGMRDQRALRPHSFGQVSVFGQCFASSLVKQRVSAANIEVLYWVTSNATQQQKFSTEPLLPGRLSRCLIELDIICRP